jgi:diacylglycerol kinase family enzyme
MVRVALILGFVIVVATLFSGLQLLAMALAAGALLAAGIVAWLGAARAAVPMFTDDADRRYPPPRRPYLIMNLRSGGGKVARYGLVERAQERGARVTVLDGSTGVDVSAWARDAVAGGADLLGVAGGDGTQAAVAAVAAEHDIPFLVINAGTRNHFALDLGLDPADPARCLDALADGVERRVDLGVVGDRAFVNNASFGAYAQMVLDPSYREDKVGVTLELLPATLARPSGTTLIVRADDGWTLAEPQAVMVSNNPYTVVGLTHAGRRPQLDSGRLGLLAVRVDTPRQAAQLVRGARAPGIITRTAASVIIDADAPRVPVGVDGEAVWLPTPVRCGIRPGVLRLRLPMRPAERPPTGWRGLLYRALRR